MVVRVSDVSILNEYDSITNECLRWKLWFFEERLEKKLWFFEERLEKNYGFFRSV
jgi:hypothetical protein